MIQFKITSVMNCETGEEVVAQSFFEQDEAVIFEVRRQLEDAICNRCGPKYTCYGCGQLVKIRGKTGNEIKLRRMHFAHQRDNGNCPIKTDQSLNRHELLAIKYDGQKKSELHLQTKDLVAHSLERNQLNQKGVTEVRTERIRRDASGRLNWRKPDVSALYKLHSLVFEIQLSTTFLSVIAGREHFYQQNQTFILWLFKSFSEDIDKQRFTEKDVFYSNNQNAFVFDEEAIEASNKQQDLILKCLYRVPYCLDDSVAYQWQEAMVGLHELTFDEQTYKTFFFDVEGAVATIEQEIEDKILMRRQQQIQVKEQRQLVENWHQVADKNERMGYDRARSLVHQVLTKIDSKPGSRSPLLQEFGIFSRDTHDRLFELFGREGGYKPSDQDRAFLNTAYELERAERSHLERTDLLTCLCLATCLIKVEKPHKAYRLKKVHAMVYVLLSVQLDCVIGQKYTKLVQVAHGVFPGKEDYAHLFLTLLAQFPASGIHKQDALSGGKLEKKIASFRSKDPKPDVSYDDVFRLIFPKLFEKKND